MLSVAVVPSGRIVEPFGDPAPDVLIQNRPLSSWLERAIAEAGGVAAGPAAPCPRLVVPDNLLASGDALRRFVALAGNGDAVLVLKSSLFAERTTPVQPGVAAVEGGYRFDAIRFESGRGEAPEPVVVDPEEKVLEIPVPPRYAEGGRLRLSLPRHPVMTVHHWVHVLWGNQAAGSMEVRRVAPWRTAARVAAAALRALSLDRHRVLAKLNRIGRGCDIHPTAVVEGSTLEDGASVGAFARVLFSHVGARATIMPAAHVEASTLGEGSTVAQRCTVRMCVLYPEAIASQELMQLCLLGRGAVTTPGSYAMDLNFEREIRVPLDGQLHGTGTRFLGSAFGHGCRVGTGIWLASGRMVPNGVLVVRDPAGVVARIPGDLPAGPPLVNDGGTLRRLDPEGDPST